MQSNKNRTSNDLYLDSFETLFDDVPIWLSTVYDKSSGGFYHNAPMLSDTAYGPDIQSTAFALTILSSGNILRQNEWKGKFKEGVIAYINSRYDPVRQMYLDPEYKEKVMQSERALARSQNMAKSIYRKLGVDLPEIRFNIENVPEHLRSFLAFETWFYKQNWDRVWTAFDRLVSNTSFLNQIPVERKDSIVGFIQHYAKSIQDDDGLWGKGQEQEVRFSGAAKYATFCENMQIPIPDPDKIYNTVLLWFRQNNYLDFSTYSPCPICVPRNALHLLACIMPYLSFEIPEHDKKVLVRSSYEMLKIYSNPDGGFMKNHKESRIAPLDVDYGKCDRLVSDMNGVQLAITARASLYEILGIDTPILKSNIEF
jgi:hypothetical protein